MNEEARDHGALMGTPEFEKSRDERKRVEMRFAHLKTHHRFERMRLRGLTVARDEFHLGAIAQNLKTLANHLAPPAKRARRVHDVRCVAQRPLLSQAANRVRLRHERDVKYRQKTLEGSLVQLIAEFFTSIGRKKMTDAGIARKRDGLVYAVAVALSSWSR